MKATVLIPTHDHGPTLRYAVASALQQTVQDLEIFVIGDGVTDEGRAVVAELVRADPRVRSRTGAVPPRRPTLPPAGRAR